MNSRDGLIKHLATCFTVCCVVVCSTISPKAASTIKSQGKIKVGSTTLFDCDDIANLDYTSPTASGTTTSFIDTVSQSDGKITATKKTIPSASTSTAGIVKLNNTLTSTSTTEALTAAQGKVLKGSIDGLSDSLIGETLWTNPKPNDSFSKQAITLSDNLSSYTLYEILFKIINTGNVLKSTGRIPTNYYISMNQAYSYNQDRRVSSISGNTLTIDDAFTYTRDSSGSIVDNIYCIPIKIIGYK